MSSLTMTSRPRSVLLATAPQFGTNKPLSASPALRDPHMMKNLETAFAPSQLLLLTPGLASVLNALMTSPFGTERLALHAPREPTTMSTPRPALSAPKA